MQGWRQLRFPTMQMFLEGQVKGRLLAEGGENPGAGVVGWNCGATPKMGTPYFFQTFTARLSTQLQEG